MKSETNLLSFNKYIYNAEDLFYSMFDYNHENKAKLFKDIIKINTTEN